ncbi:hypothetical protein ACFQY4_22125 [Catellatospora bangladeshensis]|uniref:hypothetical protein n=1 Tax=Catellatospora bangladeshensis TaxID=310355 RepID=UPI0036163E7D
MTATTTLLGSLLTPTTLAGLPLSSRFAMAPMTRFRSPAECPRPRWPPTTGAGPSTASA